MFSKILPFQDEKPAKTEAKTVVEIPHKKALTAYLEMRKAQIEATIRINEMLFSPMFPVGDSPAKIARAQADMLQGLIDQINENSPVALTNLREIFLRPELRIFKDDIDSLLAKGQTVMPRELSDFAGYFDMKKVELLEHQAEIARARKEHQKATIEAQKTAELVARRKKLADELGIELPSS